MSVATSAKTRAKWVQVPQPSYPRAVPDGRTYLHRGPKDQLFICYSPIQSAELRKMVDGLRAIKPDEVAWRALNGPFKEIIDLKRA
jgi:hypothetical protein